MEVFKEEVIHNKRQACKEAADQAYADLNVVFAGGADLLWFPSIDDWRMLENDTGELPLIRPSKEIDYGGKRKAQVVSNAHDCISAINLINVFLAHNIHVIWTHVSEFRSNDFASPDISFTILIGGPKAPGISTISEKFYNASPDKFMQLYSGTVFKPTILEVQEDDTRCYMIGGPSKAHTLEASYNLAKRLQGLL
jgi:hypothetical protein